jgi:hypothetical protein
VTGGLPVSQSVDLDAIRQVMVNGVSTYEAIRNAQTLNAQNEKTLALAEELLRRAELGYLLNNAPLVPAQSAPGTLEGMVAGYSRVQQGYADLQAAIYDLARAQIRARAWQDAKRTLDALASLDSRYRDVSDLQATLPFLATFELIRIPASDFLYGESKQRITLPEFSIAKTPITVAQFAIFVETTGYGYGFRDALQDKERASHPVVNISYYDATAFCEWASNLLGKTIRLPTEQEWEKAARAGDGRAYPWGNEPPDVTRCNFASNDTTPVGKFSPRGDSPFGCVDMAGNVCEWTASPHETGGYVTRGGSWNNVAADLRVTNRLRYLPNFPLNRVGFRCAA